MVDFLTYPEAAIEVLQNYPEGLHYKEITKLAIKHEYLAPRSEERKTPDQTLNAALNRANQKAERDGEEIPFIRVERGVYKLSDFYRKFDDDKSDTPSDKIRRILNEQKLRIKNQLLDKLLDLTPFEFEEFIGYYFNALEYENVEVTSRSNDGGIDVKATAKFGITDVNLAIQVKRYSPKNKVGRPYVDSLRGSLYRFNADQGVIITTSDFTKDAIQTSEETNPIISLIPGDLLLEHLIDYKIGVKEGKYGLVFLDTEFFEEGFSEES